MSPCPPCSLGTHFAIFEPFNVQLPNLQRHNERQYFISSPRVSHWVSHWNSASYQQQTRSLPNPACDGCPHSVCFACCSFHLLIASLFSLAPSLKSHSAWDCRAPESPLWDCRAVRQLLHVNVALKKVWKAAIYFKSQENKSKQTMNQPSCAPEFSWASGRPRLYPELSWRLDRCNNNKAPPSISLQRPS